MGQSLSRAATPEEGRTQLSCSWLKTVKGECTKQAASTRKQHSAGTEVCVRWETSDKGALQRNGFTGGCVCLSVYFI